jgi:hypothetical protein
MKIIEAEKVCPSAFVKTGCGRDLYPTPSTIIPIQATVLYAVRIWGICWISGVKKSEETLASWVSSSRNLFCAAITDCEA